MIQRIDPILFHTTDWSSVPTNEDKGKTGTAKWQAIQVGQLRVRLVEYSENYKASQWCNDGRVFYCLDGEMTVELSDGRTFNLTTGMSYEVMHGFTGHRLISHGGVRALIIDGPFLKPEKRNFNPWKM